MKKISNTNFDEDKWSKYREGIDGKLWRYIDENGQYIHAKFGHANLYPYVSKFKFDWTRCTMPKKTEHLSRYKTVTIEYELASTDTEDRLLKFLSVDKPFDDIKVLTVHSGYTRNPLDPNAKDDISDKDGG